MEKVFLTVSPGIDAWSPSIYFFEGYRTKRVDENRSTAR